MERNGNFSLSRFLTVHLSLFKLDTSTLFGLLKLSAQRWNIFNFERNTISLKVFVFGSLLLTSRPVVKSSELESSSDQIKALWKTKKLLVYKIGTNFGRRKEGQVLESERDQR